MIGKISVGPPRLISADKQRSLGKPRLFLYDETEISYNITNKSKKMDNQNQVENLSAPSRGKVNAALTLSVIAIILSVMALTAVYGSYRYLRGEAEIIDEERSVGSFNKLDYRGSAKINITQGETEKLVLRGDSQVIANVETSVSDGVLKIDQKDPVIWILFLPLSDLEINLQVKDLEQIKISGSAQIATRDTELKADRLDLDISGSAQAEMALKVQEITSEVFGSGRFSLTGQASRQSIKIDGSGEYHARDLVSQEARVDISGSGRVALDVTEKLEVKISGSGEVYYKGMPEVSQNISGSGRIIHVAPE